MSSVLPERLRGDGPCADCGTPDNIVWYTDSVFWNAVCRLPGRHDDCGSNGIICITCFVKRADAVGYAPTGWRLVPDRLREAALAAADSQTVG